MIKLFYLLVFVPLWASSQKIEENKVDEFTHAKVVRTSWEPIVKKFGGHNIAHFRVSKINASCYLDFRIMRDNGIMAMDQGDELMLKMDGDSIIRFTNPKYQISCAGGGSVPGSGGSGLQGLDLSFSISANQAAYLGSHKVKKLRIYLTDGYLEEEIKDKFAATFVNQINLIK